MDIFSSRTIIDHCGQNHGVEIELELHSLQILNKNYLVEINH